MQEKIINERLRHTQSQMLQKKSIESVSTLVAGIAHELRNPLSIVLGMADVLEEIVKDEHIDRIEVKEIISSFNSIQKELEDYNIVFTVSPVRHAKDGLHENNLSKYIILINEMYLSNY